MPSEDPRCVDTPQSSSATAGQGLCAAMRRRGRVHRSGIGHSGGRESGSAMEFGSFLTSCSPNRAPRRILDPITPAALSQLEQLARILDLPLCPHCPTQRLITSSLLPNLARPPPFSPSNSLPKPQRKESARVDAHSSPFGLDPSPTRHSTAGKWLPIIRRCCSARIPSLSLTTAQSLNSTTTTQTSPFCDTNSSKTLLVAILAATEEFATFQTRLDESRFPSIPVSIGRLTQAAAEKRDWPTGIQFYTAVHCAPTYAVSGLAR